MCMARKASTFGKANFAGIIAAAARGTDNIGGTRLP